MLTASTWGTDAAERALSYPCDRYVERPEAAYWPAVGRLDHDETAAAESEAIRRRTLAAEP